MTSLFCDVCCKVFQRVQLIRHMRIHTGDRPFQCRFCGLTSALSTAMKKHEMYKCALNQLETLDGVRIARNVQCKVCAKFCRNAHYLRIHQKRLHADNRPVFECDSCIKRFASKLNLMQHAKTVHNLQRLECDECDQKYCSFHALQTHLKCRHFDGRNALQCICDDCGMLASNSVAVQWHVENVHQNVKKEFRCAGCGKYFLTARSMRNHQTACDYRRKIVQLDQEVAAESAPFRCDVCEKLCSAKWVFIDHSVSNHSNMPQTRQRRQVLSNQGANQQTKNTHSFRCRFCEQTFVGTNVQRHERDCRSSGIRPESLTCSLCKYSSWKVTALKMHMTTAHGDLKFTFHCDLCDKVFRTKAILIGHAAVVHASTQAHNRPNALLNAKVGSRDVKLLQCSKCSKCFARASALRYHESQHVMNSTTEYHCRSCDRSFSAKARLNAHARVHAKRAEAIKTLEAHMKDDDDVGTKIFLHCDLCNRALMRPGLVTHVFVQHANQM